MSRRHPITALVRAAILAIAAAASVVIGVGPGSAQTDSRATPPRQTDASYFADLGADAPTVLAEPWVGWYGPLDDGLLGLRFGMDRFEVGRRMRERGLEGQASRPGTQRFEGALLGSTGEVLTEFRPDAQAPNGERLSRVQISWRIDGVPNRAVDLFERLDAMLESRYGEPLLSTEDGYAALDSGWGEFRRGYVGPQAKALLVVEAIRSQRFRVVISLESPQLHVAQRNRDED